MKQLLQPQARAARQRLSIIGRLRRPTYIIYSHKLKVENGKRDLDAEGERRKGKGGKKGLASAGERKANDWNGATESVACLSEASLQREQRNAGRE